MPWVPGLQSTGGLEAVLGTDCTGFRLTDPAPFCLASVALPPFALGIGAAPFPSLPWVKTQVSGDTTNNPGVNQ